MQSATCCFYSNRTRTMIWIATAHSYAAFAPSLVYPDGTTSLRSTSFHFTFSTLTAPTPTTFPASIQFFCTTSEMLNTLAARRRHENFHQIEIARRFPPTAFRQEQGVQLGILGRVERIMLRHGP
mmetsp:Transcript_20279/g.56503  ORF Transcript_20279/g.56503 Transcript_20279/m.56503 type:complete len:125 (+) Transcript_20279:78-452(+)